MFLGNTEIIMQLRCNADILGKRIPEQLFVLTGKGLTSQSKQGGRHIAGLLYGQLPPKGIAVSGGRLIGHRILHGWYQAVAHTDIEGRILLHNGIKPCTVTQEFIVIQREGDKLMSSSGVFLP